MITAAQTTRGAVSALIVLKFKGKKIDKTKRQEEVGQPASHLPYETTTYTYTPISDHWFVEEITD